MKLILFCCLGLLPFMATSQITILSQYQFVPTYGNPSTVGANTGIRAATSYRRQWTALNVPYESKFLSFDARGGGKLGLGAKVLSQVEGDGLMSTTGGHVAGAFHSYFQLGKKKPFKQLVNFHVGGEIGYIQRSIDLSGLIFSDQIDPALGLIEPRSAAVLPGSIYRSLLINFGGGLNGVWGSSQKSIWYIGYAANNIHRYSKSFINDFTVRSRIAHFARVSIVCNAYDLAGRTKKRRALKDHYFILGYRLSGQKGFALVHDINLVYTQNHLITGFGYRNSMRGELGVEGINGKSGNRHFMIAQLGVSMVPRDKLAMQMVYSYDFGVNTTPGYAGHTHEISLSLYNSSFGNTPQPKMNNCHDYTQKNVLPIW